MNWYRVLRARLFALRHKAQLETEMEEELRFHLQMRAQENEQRGMPAAAAALAAQRQFGNINAIKDAWRDITGGGIIEAFGQDVRFAWRMLLRDRAFAVISVLALGLGIGANTILFTVVSNVLLRPLPYPAPSKIMAISMLEDGNPDRPFRFCFPDFADLPGENPWFEELGAFASASFVVGGGYGETIHAEGTRVTPGAMRLLGVPCTLGRIFFDTENEAGNRSVLISHELWRQRFHGALTVLGAALTIDGYEYRVIGVMPPDFHFPIRNEPSQVWTTFARDREPSPGGTDILANHRDAHYLQVLGRLKNNVSRQDAVRGFNEIVSRLAATYPETNRRLISCAVVPWLTQITDNVRPALLILFGAAFCVLCLACTNIANLLLARASTRQKEIAIRAALGAGRGRILRQLLAESILLSAIGGCLGLLLALLGTNPIVALLPPDFPRSGNIAPDFQMLAFTGIITVVTSCLFGFAPAWHAARCELARVLNDCSRVPGGTPRGRRARSALVMQGFWSLTNTPLGFNPKNLVTASVSLPENAKEASSPVSAFYRKVLGRLENSPGIQSVAAVYPLPFTSRGFADFEIEGRSMAKADLPRARAHTITTNYFRTMQIPLKAGRDFDDRDGPDGPPSVIVNETLARTIFPNKSALGKRIRPGLTDGSGPVPEREIVGVVGDVKSDDLASGPMSAMYLPHPQCAATDMVVLLRGEGGAEMVATLQQVVHDVDPKVPVYQSHRMEDYVAISLAQVRLSSIVLTIFAVAALILTGVGVYGVMAYSVAQRRHEIGIRLALGAQQLTVFRLILNQGLRLLGWSLLAGGICTAVFIKLLQTAASLAPGSELVTIAFVALVVFGVALLACWWPAWRAAEVDPLQAIGQR
jgi:predicted permease